MQNDNDTRKLKYSEENLSQWRLVQHGCHMHVDLGGWSTAHYKARINWLYEENSFEERTIILNRKCTAWSQNWSLNAWKITAGSNAGFP